VLAFAMLEPFAFEFAIFTFTFVPASPQAIAAIIAENTEIIKAILRFIPFSPLVTSNVKV
jgi:hypothetical protein